MSLVVSTVLKGVVIIGADTRAVQRSGDCVHYDDTIKRIVPFSSSAAVAFCGDTNISDFLLVSDFLRKFRETYFKEHSGVICIHDLAKTILDESLRKNPDSDIIYSVAGFSKGFCNGEVYVVSTESGSCESVVKFGDFGAACIGISDLANSFMNNDVCYDLLSFKEGVDLVRTCINSNIIGFRYRKEQLVGGHCELLAFNELSGEHGWVNGGRDSYYIDSYTDFPLDFDDLPVLGDEEIHIEGFH